MCKLLIITSEFLHMSVNKDSLEKVVWSLSLESTQLNGVFLEKTVAVFYRNNFTKIFTYLRVFPLRILKKLGLTAEKYYHYYIFKVGNLFKRVMITYF